MFHSRPWVWRHFPQGVEKPSFGGKYVAFSSDNFLKTSGNHTQSVTGPLPSARRKLVRAQAVPGQSGPGGGVSARSIAKPRAEHPFVSHPPPRRLPQVQVAGEERHRPTHGVRAQAGARCVRYRLSVGGDSSASFPSRMALKTKLRPAPGAPRSCPRGRGWEALPLPPAHGSPGLSASGGGRLSQAGLKGCGAHAEMRGFLSRHLYAPRFWVRRCQVPGTREAGAACRPLQSPSETASPSKA